jgi:hypothetical protein
MDVIYERPLKHIQILLKSHQTYSIFSENQTLTASHDKNNFPKKDKNQIHQPPNKHKKQFIFANEEP